MLDNQVLDDEFFFVTAEVTQQLACFDTPDPGVYQCNIWLICPDVNMCEAQIAEDTFEDCLSRTVCTATVACELVYHVAHFRDQRYLNAMLAVEDLSDVRLEFDELSCGLCPLLAFDVVVENPNVVGHESDSRVVGRKVRSTM